GLGRIQPSSAPHAPKSPPISRFAWPSALTGWKCSRRFSPAPLHRDSSTKVMCRPPAEHKGDVGIGSAPPSAAITAHRPNLVVGQLPTGPLAGRVGRHSFGAGGRSPYFSPRATTHGRTFPRDHARRIEA